MIRVNAVIDRICRNFLLGPTAYGNSVVSVRGSVIVFCLIDHGVNGGFIRCQALDLSPPGADSLFSGTVLALDRNRIAIVADCVFKVG